MWAMTEGIKVNSEGEQRDNIAQCLQLSVHAFIRAQHNPFIINKDQFNTILRMDL